MAFKIQRNNFQIRNYFRKKIAPNICYFTNTYLHNREITLSIQTLVVLFLFLFSASEKFLKSLWTKVPGNGLGYPKGQWGLP